MKQIITIPTWPKTIRGPVLNVGDIVMWQPSDRRRKPIKLIITDAYPKPQKHRKKKAR